MVRRARFLLLLILPLFLIPLLPTATAQPDGASSCAAALAAANGGATRWNGYKIVRAPQQGSSGSDVVLGTEGNDTLQGLTGSDLLCGFGGDDTLRGSTGDDILVGGPGADAMYGETGDDTLYADAQDVVVNGGTGRNKIIQAIPTPTPTPITPTATPITPTATPITPTATPITPTATPITPTATPLTPTAVPQPSVSIIFQADAGGCRVFVVWENFPPADALTVGIYSGDGTLIGGGTTNYVPNGTLYSNNVLPNGGPATVYAEVSPPLTTSSPIVPSC